MARFPIKFKGSRAIRLGEAIKSYPLELVTASNNGMRQLDPHLG